MKEKHVRRFWEQVEKTDGCWFWFGEANEQGYGRAWDGTRVWYAHRLSWRLANGDPGDQCVLHRCDTPNCVNPSHLFLGTRTDNIADCVAKGRGAKGSKNGFAKLTEVDIVAIRARRDAGAPCAEVGLAYGISGATVCRIHQRKIWRHVP